MIDLERVRASSPGTIDLAGPWRAHLADADLVRDFADPAYRDDDWLTVALPGHWRSTPELAASDGPLLYRRPVVVPALDADRRRFATFDGIFYYGDVWLDGAYLGATEGYFSPHTFELPRTDTETEHLLALEVTSPRAGRRAAKRTVTGVFSHWDALDPEWNPGGIWRPMRVHETGPVRIARLRCVCSEAGDERGRLLLDLTLDAGETPPVTPLPARLTATVTGPDGALLAVADREVQLAAGDNHLAWAIDAEDPPRWWPWRFGDQPLCDVTVTVALGEEASDERRLRTAFREVRMRDWQVTVNGERLFAMGTNLAPTRAALGEALPEELAGDVALARNANLDLVRVHAHVTRPELYDAADAAGVLVWQDLPLQWGYARSVRRSAVAQAREMVDLLGHHPSVAIWCAHNEPLALDMDTGDQPTGRQLARLGASMFLPTWNKDVLDRSVARALRRADPTRPVDVHSGVLPGLTSTGTDTHWYFGWYHGRMDGLAAAVRAMPRLGRFVTELGAQAVPTADGFCEPTRWPDLDWDHLEAHHSLQRRIFDRHVPPAAFDSFAGWRDATQAYQAALLQLQVEDLRRVRLRPTGGFCQFSFADSAPGVTWSVLDHERRPKAGYAALRDACRTVLPMLDPREGLVHVANEGRTAIPDATVTVTVDGRAWSFAGDLAADDLAYVGRVGPLLDATHAEVRLEAPGRPPVVNVYDLVLEWLRIVAT